MSHDVHFKGQVIPLYILQSSSSTKTGSFGFWAGGKEGGWTRATRSFIGEFISLGAQCGGRQELMSVLSSSKDTRCHSVRSTTGPGGYARISHTVCTAVICVALKTQRAV